MKSLCKCLGALLLLATLSGCSKGFEVCSAVVTENCRTFRSEAHYQRWVKGETRRRYLIAQHFPDDYRDVVAATLKDYFRSNASEFPNHRRQYFLSVFGADPDATMLAKLQQLGIEALPSSNYLPDPPDAPPRDSQGVYLDNHQIYVSDIKRLASGVYRIEFGYFCGELCAGHLAYQLSKRDGSWVFISRKALWAS